MDLHLHLLLPEILVVATVLLLVTADLLLPAARRSRIVPLVAGFGLAVALLVLVLDGRTGGAVLGHFVVDGSAGSSAAWCSAPGCS
jgi:NADH:ubiquinone oxidoreductase subunit 2 (subunit N)